jgi:hypothetical protein
MHDKTTSDLLSYFIEVSRERWKTPEANTVQWSVGQPMGLGPSFGSFAFFHNVILHLAHQEAKSEKHPLDTFRIVGDDVVIACDKVHTSYLKALKVLKIPVSESKCISSKVLTEFVGRIITHDATYPTIKWKNTSDNNFIDVMKFLGPSSTTLLQKRQRKMVKVLAPIPECFGGLGWNPKGLSYEMRIAYATHIGVFDESTEVEPSRDLTSAIVSNLNKVAYSGNVSFSGTPYKGTKLNEPCTPSTEGRVSRIVRTTKVHSDVNPLVAKTSFFRQGPVLTTGDPRGKSRLENLESKFGHKETIDEWLSPDEEAVMATSNA